jgi:hypothetical protein
MDAPAIVHLSRMIIPPSVQVRLLALFISAHFDESGTHAGSPYTVMGGYVATEHQWAFLDRDWKELLSKFDLTSFHSKELFITRMNSEAGNLGKIANSLRRLMRF